MSPAIANFCGPSYTLRSPWAALDRTVNLVPTALELPRPGRAEGVYLRSAPGLRPIITLAEGPIRGFYTATNGRCFAVHGTLFSELLTPPAAFRWGTLDSSQGPVHMADNGLELFLATGGTGYLFTFATNTLTAIADVDYPDSPDVVFLDGYFLFFTPGTGRFGITGLYNGGTVDALDVATAEGSPDVLRRLLVVNRELWAFGTQSIEPFFHSGAGDFPFLPIKQAFMRVGLAATESAVVLGEIPYWVGQDEHGDGVVYRAQGYRAQRISTHAIEEAIQAYARIDDALAFGVQFKGHDWYVLAFPTGNQTWVYDALTGFWHERASRLPDHSLGMWRGRMGAFFARRHLVADPVTRDIYQLDDTWLWDGVFGQEHVRLRRCPVIEQGTQYATHSRLRVFCETGVGLDGGVVPGTDPQILMQYSDTFGKTWSEETAVSLGALGQYQPGVEWRRLGRTRARCYQIAIADPVNVVITGASLNDPL